MKKRVKREITWCVTRHLQTPSLQKEGVKVKEREVVKKWVTKRNNTIQPLEQKPFKSYNMRDESIKTSLKFTQFLSCLTSVRKILFKGSDKGIEGKNEMKLETDAEGITEKGRRRKWKEVGRLSQEKVLNSQRILSSDFERERENKRGYHKILKEDKRDEIRKQINPLYCFEENRGTFQHFESFEGGCFSCVKNRDL